MSTSRLASLVAVVAVVAGGSGVAVALRQLGSTGAPAGALAAVADRGPVEASPVVKAAPVATAAPALRPRAAQVALPARLTIPRLGIRTGLERLGTDAAGRLAPPRDPNRAGWYAAGPRPGQQGPAVVVGHVDSRTGPAVFADLDRLRAGDAVLVRDAAGRTVRFRVVELRRVPRDRFPTATVYGPTPEPALRLVTCGGGYDRAAGRYRANVVVYAVAA